MSIREQTRQILQVRVDAFGELHMGDEVKRLSNEHPIVQKAAEFMIGIAKGFCGGTINKSDLPKIKKERLAECLQIPQERAKSKRTKKAEGEGAKATEEAEKVDEQQPKKRLTKKGSDRKRKSGDQSEVGENYKPSEVGENCKPSEVDKTSQLSEGEKTSQPSEGSQSTSKTSKLSEGSKTSQPSGDSNPKQRKVAKASSASLQKEDSNASQPSEVDKQRKASKASTQNKKGGMTDSGHAGIRKPPAMDTLEFLEKRA